MTRNPTILANQQDAPLWQQRLDELEAVLREASVAIVLLRQALAAGHEASAPPPAPMTLVTEDEEQAAELDIEPEAITPPETAEARAGALKAGLSAFDRLWDRVEQEKLTKEEGAAEAQAQEQRRGLALLPQQYLMTVEDREGKVDLVPLHRGLLSLAVVEELSLVSYANGVPVLSLRTQGDLDMDRLRDAVAVAMDRECEVIQQDANRLYLRLREHDSGAGG